MSWNPSLSQRRDTLARMTTLPSPRDPCPCCSGASFGGCCAPILAGEAAPSALALMRSRYSAYVLGDEDHLLRSWHPKTRPAPPFCDPKIEWLGLQIVDVDAGGENDSEGIVEFIASWRSPAKSVDSSRVVRASGASQGVAGAASSASGAAFSPAESDSSASAKGSSPSDTQSRFDGVSASFAVESMRERSCFLRRAGRWVYVDGDVR